MEAAGLGDTGSLTLSLSSFFFKGVELLKDAWQYFRRSCQKHNRLSGVRRTHLRHLGPYQDTGVSGCNL